MFEKMYKPLQWKLSCSHTTNLINADDQMLLIIRIIMPYNWYAPCYLYKLQQSHLWMEYKYKKKS